MNSLYQEPHHQRNEYSVPLDEQRSLLDGLQHRTDAEADRLKRYLALPDLTRLEGNPVKVITDRIINLPSLIGFDLIETPLVIPSEVVFDLFNFPKNHPARGWGDTYYINETHILRPHTSLMWKYYLEIPAVKEKLEAHGSVGAICYGTVFRRDEIDWQHSNVLHHIDGLFVCRKSIKNLQQSDLEIFFGKLPGRFSEAVSSVGSMLSIIPIRIQALRWRLRGVISGLRFLVLALSIQK